MHRTFTVPRLSNEERFWSHVSKALHPKECWEWQLTTDDRKDATKGYGWFKLTIPTRKNVLAHRYAYELTYGPILSGLQVLHECDNPRCVRPSHLKLGTHQQNHDDCTAKGRRHGRPGEQHHGARLTESIVLEIKRLHAQGLSYVDIAAKLDQPYMRVYKAGTGRRWAHLSPACAR